MADLPSQSSKLSSSVVQFERALSDLIRVFEGKPRLYASDSELPHDEAPPELALPSGEAHSEAAQLLMQRTPGWHVPTPSTLPAPTYAPATTAFGIILIALGAVTVWPLSVIGGLIFVLGLSIWIGDLLP
jgi:hypothetical protein